MVLALSSTISWSKVDYYYGVSWCSSVPHEGFTGFQGTVNWSPIGSREACTGSQGAVQDAFKPGWWFCPTAKKGNYLIFTISSLIITQWS